jgi:hypothetical protein
MAKVNPIPEGYSTVVPDISVKSARDAIAAPRALAPKLQRRRLDPVPLATSVREDSSRL